jgi:hypothetical protein
MRAESVLAEGLGQGLPGIYSVIGIHQNLLVTESVPVAVKRAVFTHVVAEPGEIEPGQFVRFAIRVEDPSGSIISANTGSIPVAPVPFPKLPAVFDIPAETLLNFDQFGTYTFTVEVTPPSGETMSQKLHLYVTEPPAEMPS